MFLGKKLKIFAICISFCYLKNMTPYSTLIYFPRNNGQKFKLIKITKLNLNGLDILIDGS